MRMLFTAKMCTDTFNALVKAGTAGSKIKKILEDLKPEATYFTAIDGRRTAVLIINLTDPSQIPSIAEPWFLNFNAELQFLPIMGPEDLAKSGLDTLAKKWA